MSTTTIVLVVGFSVLGLATVKSVTYFGLLSAIAMSAALVADLMMVPAMLVVLRPKL
jgi:predicted RND superfamily exporter protein